MGSWEACVRLAEELGFGSVAKAPPRGGRRALRLERASGRCSRHLRGDGAARGARPRLAARRYRGGRPHLREQSHRRRRPRFAARSRDRSGKAPGRQSRDRDERLGRALSGAEAGARRALERHHRDEPRFPDSLQRIGWTGGEAITDSQLRVDYYRTTRDGRIAFGKGAGAIAHAGRMGPEFEKNERAGKGRGSGSARVLPFASAALPSPTNGRGPSTSR